MPFVSMESSPVYTEISLLLQKYGKICLTIFNKTPVNNFSLTMATPFFPCANQHKQEPFHQSYKETALFQDPLYIVNIRHAQMPAALFSKLRGNERFVIPSLTSPAFSSFQ